MRRRISRAPVAFVVVGVAMTTSACAGESAESPAAETIAARAPIALYLQVIVAPEGYESLAEVWATAADEATDNFEPESRLVAGDLAELADDWRGALIFERVGESGWVALDGIPAATAPQSDQQEPGIQTARAVMPAAAWAAGDRLRARLAGDGWEAISQEVVIELPTAEAEFRARATIAQLGGDAAALEQVANEVLATDAGDHAGHYYRGLALELVGDFEEAEASLIAALGSFSADPRSRDIGEAPSALLTALSRVRAALR